MSHCIEETSDSIEETSDSIQETFRFVKDTSDRIALSWYKITMMQITRMVLSGYFSQILFSQTLITEVKCIMFIFSYPLMFFLLLVIVNLKYSSKISAVSTVQVLPCIILQS
jgi:hypothetical protein